MRLTINFLSYIFSMNPKVFLGLALAACAINSAAAIVGFSSLGLTASSAGSSAGLTGLVGGAAVGSPLFVTGSGFVLAAGIVGLKALALHNILEAQSRKKRAAEETDLAFVPIAVSEPEACYKRFICDLATGSLPKSENDVILSLFNKPTSTDSPKFAFSQAATLGKVSKQVQSCEVRYSCQLTGQQIAKLFN